MLDVLRSTCICKDRRTVTHVRFVGNPSPYTSHMDDMLRSPLPRKQRTRYHSSELTFNELLASSSACDEQRAHSKGLYCTDHPFDSLPIIEGFMTRKTAFRSSLEPYVAVQDVQQRALCDNAGEVTVSLTM